MKRDIKNNTQEVVLEDFEEFDSRDLMNVLAYFTMGSGKHVGYIDFFI